MNNLPWIEKYRAKNLDDIINHDDDIKAIKNLINAKSLTNMLFYGPPGTGKTSLILAIARYLYGEKNYDFNLLYNARNIRRKSVPDLMLAWKIFIDQLPEDKAKKCALTMHTQIVDDNGTDLPAVQQMLFGNNPKYNIVFSTGTQILQ